MSTDKHAVTLVRINMGPAFPAQWTARCPTYGVLAKQVDRDTAEGLRDSHPKQVALSEVTR